MKLTSVILLLSILLGLFGCTVAPSHDDGSGENEENSNLLTGSGVLEGPSPELSPESFLNLAATDENGEPIFQIVYDTRAGLRVQEQCQALSADIFNATGVTVPVVHSSMPQKEYELTVGAVKRSETIDAIDSFRLEENDFAICTVGTRILIYAESEPALISGMIYFMDQSVTLSTTQVFCGIEKDYNLVYHPADVPPIEMLESDGHYVNFRLENGSQANTYVRLSYTGHSGWRLQTKYREGDVFRDHGASQQLAYSLGEYQLSSVDARFYTQPVTTTQIGGVYTVTGPDKSRVEINLEKFQMDFFTPSGKLASTVTSIAQNAGGGSIKGVLEEGEAIYGTGERFNSANQRGKKIEMFTKDLWSQAGACYMVVPLLCSSRGSGIFLNNYEHMMLDLGSFKTNEWSAVITGAPIDCYVYTTEKIAEVIQAYSELSGYANMPEEWSYGMIVCAYYPDLSKKWTVEGTKGEGVYEMIAHMEEYDLPWTGVLAEAWAGGNENLKELCEYVHSLGKKFLVYIRVGNVAKTATGFDEAYLLEQIRADGTMSSRLPDTTAGTNNPDVGPGARTNIYIDITDPEATFWYFNSYLGLRVNEVDVDGFKVDFCESLPENYELNYFDKNIPTAGSHHWYPTAFCAKLYDFLSQKPDSGMCYSRGGGIGSQRSPYMWAGDQAREWTSLKYQLTAVLSSGLSGVPYMSYDMGGYQYSSASQKTLSYESQVFLRSVQFSAYTVCMQTHGNVRRSYQFAQYTDANGEHPYEYVTDIYRAYTKLHEHLTPYISELTKEASTTGLPLMRHLILGWQSDTNVYNIEDEYTFGDAFLIAPILDDVSSRTVYLPCGTWEDLNTGTVYEVGEEGMEIEVTANIAELPSFFNVNTESETARDLVDGIKAIYDYARSLVP